MMDHPLTVRTIYQRSRTLFPDNDWSPGDRVSGRGAPGPPTASGPSGWPAWPVACASWASARVTRWPPSAGTTTGTWRCTSRPP